MCFPSAPHLTVLTRRSQTRHRCNTFQELQLITGAGNTGGQGHVIAGAEPVGGQEGEHKSGEEVRYKTKLKHDEDTEKRRM